MNIHIEKELPCNGQCQQECTGHSLILDCNTVSNIITLSFDGDKVWLDINEVRVLKDIVKELLDKY